MSGLALRLFVMLVVLPGAAMAQARSEAKLDEMCGGIAGIQCGQGLFCDPEPGLCKGADIAGRCVEVPGACTLDYRPVCGCDGKTYGNDCERLTNRATKDRDGPCN